MANRKGPGIAKEIIGLLQSLDEKITKMATRLADMDVRLSRLEPAIVPEPKTREI